MTGLGIQNIVLLEENKSALYDSHLIGLLGVEVRCQIFGHHWPPFAYIRCNISNTGKSVSSEIQTLRSGWKNEAQAEFSFPNFEVFDI